MKVPGIRIAGVLSHSSKRVEMSAAVKESGWLPGLEVLQEFSERRTGFQFFGIQRAVAILVVEFHGLLGRLLGIDLKTRRGCWLARTTGDHHQPKARQQDADWYEVRLMTMGILRLMEKPSSPRGGLNSMPPFGMDRIMGSTCCPEDCRRCGPRDSGR